MTTRTLTRTYSAGYTLNARFSALIATTTASVGGIGIVANATATITNSGVVAAGAAAAGVEQHAGILLSAGGEVVNYGAIAGGLGSIGIASSSYIGEPGGDGVYIATGSITNRGTIAGGQGGASGKKGADGGTGGDGVYLRGVGSVTNTAGTISGGAGGSGVLSGGGAGFCAVENAQLANSSVIVGGAGGVGGYGIELLSGASVTNSGSVIGGAGAGVYRGGPGAYLLEGGTIDNSGEIMGGAGGATSPGGTWGAAGIIMGGYGTLTNTGTVAGGVGGLGAGITLRAGGVVANGDTSHTDALVSGYDGVESSDVGMVVNDGVITGSGAKSQAAGVAIDTGVVDNGSLGDEAALIRGANGVSVQTSGTVSNYGTIKGSTYGGVVFRGTGSLSNGSSSDTTALIRGYFGVEGAATVDNFATIAASTAKGAFGVSIGLGGYLLNGTAAQVSGSDALVDNGVAVNLGLISGAASQAGEYGVLLFGSSSLTNGKNARIDGYCGVYVSSAGTLINSGTIAATGRRAVRFTSPDGTLIVEAGATFIGGVYGDGCALVMGSGAGTLGGFSDNNVTLSASTPTTTFTDFASLDLDSGTTFSLPAGGTVSGDGTLVAAGSLNVGGTLTNDGVLTLTGTLAGAGSLLINGAAHFDSGSDLAVANVTEGYASATASFGTSNLGYAGLWTQTSGTLSASAGDRVNFTGTGDSFEGTLSGTGTIAFIGGSDTFAGAQLTAASLIINGATVTLSGALGLSGKMSVTTDDLAIASGGASLAGGGVLTLSDFETNKVSGGTLTNVNDLIRGAGALGDGSMGLVNDAGGIIDGDQFAALTIDTGSSTITNAGTIEATAQGTTTIASAIDNGGVLAALGGNLTVGGAVTGTGKVEIDGGTADFAGTLTQNAAFIGVGGGTLELTHSEAYTGEISGFSRTGTTTLDLEDISFVSGTTGWSYSGTAASGVLTVQDGTQVSRITLEGNYTSSAFTLSSDGHGGTNVVDPPAPSSVHTFISAAAAIGDGAGESLPTHDGDLFAPPMLAKPGIWAA